MMEQRAIVRVLRRLFEAGRLTQDQLDALLLAGRITEAEHAWIIGG